MLEAESFEQAQSQPLIEFIAPAYRAAFGVLHRKVMQGDSGTLEFEVIGLQGTRRWLETQAVPLRDPEGQIAGLLGVTHDVTERRRANQALRDSERRYHTLSNVAPVGIFQTGLSGSTTYVNPHFSEVTGLAAGGGGPEGLARCGPSGGRRARAGGMVPGFRPSAGLRRRAPVPSLRRDRPVGACLCQSGTRPRRQLQWLHRHDHRHHREAAGRARDRVAEPRAGDDCEGISSRRNADHAAAFRRGTGAGHAVVDPAARCRRDPPATWRRTEPASGLREGSRRCANRRARGALRYRGLSPPPCDRRRRRHRPALERLQGARSGVRASRLLVDTHLRRAGRRPRDLRDALPGATPAATTASAPHPALHVARRARDCQRIGRRQLCGRPIGS